MGEMEPANFRRDLLREILIRMHDEADFWRSRSWDAAKSAIGLMAFLAGASFLREVNSSRWVVTFGVIGIGSSATVYLFKCYNSLRKTRERMSELERELGVEGVSILGARPLPDPRGTGSFVAAVWLTGLAVIAGIWTAVAQST